MSQQEQAQVQENESGKVAKKFEQNIKKITAVLGGAAPLKGSKKVPKDAVGGVVEELLKERKEEAAKKLKVDLGGLIDAKLAYDKALAEEEKKLAKFKEDKMKEFNQKAEGILNQIDGIGELERSYYQTLGQVAGAPAVEVSTDEASENK